MKKMMIIAAMVSMMLIPAQMEAKNKVNNKAKVEYRNDKKDFGKKDDKKFKNNKKDKNNKKKDEKPQAMIKMPAPRPAALPQAQVKVIKEVNPVSAVASAIGLVALAAIIAN